MSVPQGIVRERTRRYLECGGLTPLSGHVAMRALSLKARAHFRERYLEPALRQCLIEMTIPGKPRSCRQAYRLPAAGRGVLKAWKGAK